MMKAKFMINISNGTFGAGNTQITAANVIKIEDFKPHANFDYSTDLVNTYTKYLGKDVYAVAVLVNGNDLLNNPMPAGYNSGFTHALGVDDYVDTLVKIVNADQGDIWGGGFHSLESYFGARGIGFFPEEIAFEISAADNIIDPTKDYLFYIKHTTTN